jgi:hypothetical protein
MGTVGTTTVLRWGLEAEFGLVDRAGALVDFTHPRGPELQQIVDSLPDHADEDLTRGDLAIKWSRWYVEGDERFADDGRFLRCVPKGIEVRTPVADGVTQAVTSLCALTAELASAASSRGLRLTAVGHNPIHSTYAPEPPFNPWERRMREEHAEYAAPEVYMCTYGPDVNLSAPAWTEAEAMAAATRLAQWAPEIVAFSLNAPIVHGLPYGGLSYRTAVRAGRRPNVRLFLPTAASFADQGTPADQGIVADQGTVADEAVCAGLVVRPARIPAERGRIEFKALDAFADLGRFAAYAALIGGLATADGAPAPSEIETGLDPDPAARLRAAAVDGFADDALVARCQVLLDLAADAWSAAPERGLLESLRADLRLRRVPAHDVLEALDGRISWRLPELVQPS